MYAVVVGVAFADPHIGHRALRTIAMHHDISTQTSRTSQATALGERRARASRILERSDVVLACQRLSRHKKRPVLKPYWPVHVVLRVAPDVGSLRKRLMYRALREATRST